MKFPDGIKCISIIGCIIFSSLLYILNFYTPLQSDDYGYALIGFNFESHLHHYLTWSGRVVADVISPVLLSIASKPIISVIQTIGVLLVVYMISNCRDITSKKGLFILSFISYVFFLSHPSFGQSNLWIVGSANYLWTSVLYVFVAKEVIGYVQKNSISVITYPAAILAGCTNENASLTLIGIILLCNLFIIIKSKSVDMKLASILILTVIGAIVLLATPGNESRLMDPSFAEWRSLSFVDKVTLHVFERMPEAIKSSKLAYSLAIVSILLCLRSNKPRLITDDGKPTDLLISVVLLLASIGCSLVMAFSPAFPDRAKTPSFIFCLMSIAYSLSSMRIEMLTQSLLKSLYAIVFVTFVVEAFPVVSTYKSIQSQNAMRIKLIDESKESEKETLIPEFFFKFLPSSTYIFDTWTNFDAMSKYYNRNKIVAYGTAFDYSVIDGDDFKIHEGSDMYTENGLKAIYMYTEKYTFDTVFLFEVTHKEKLSEQPNQRIFFHITDVIGNYHNFDFDPNYAYVNDRVFLYAKLHNMPSWYIKGASFGTFNSTIPSKRYSQLDFNI